MNKLSIALLLLFVCSLFLMVPTTEAKTVAPHHIKKHHKQHHAVRHHKAHRAHAA
jgi:hypothetical protein